MHLPADDLRRVAPEVLMGGRNCTVAVDIYSFSVVLWEIFTGKQQMVTQHSTCGMPAAKLLQ